MPLLCNRCPVPNHGRSFCVRISCLQAGSGRSCVKLRFLCLALATLPAAAVSQEQETWNAHFQSTYIWQKKPSFTSRYEGPNSLTAARERSYSLTGTAAFGLRLGSAIEVYFDPEVALGVPLSGLLGLAGFTNGELAKTSGANPTLYRARLFVRHTVGLGGEPTKVEGAANQLAGSYDSRRLVLTAGNLALLDIFDGNSFARDPRTQFMNWVLMTHGAYDYAADSRGYTNGLAAEYFDDRWTLRIGRFAQPLEPNQLKLDNRLLRHYGDQVEVSRSYDVGNQSGVVRLLAFRTRAVMASYEDALAAARSSGGAPDINAVRTVERTKTGFGVNIEHRVRDDIGLFARAMHADGKTETYAFTETDRSISAGLSLRGDTWQRADDAVGVAVAANFLSAPHQAYLARGGLTFFLGDGALRYGPERIVEAYYSFSIHKSFRLTADYQRISNPGYNAARGPASFYALRLHWEN